MKLMILNRTLRIFRDKIVKFHNLPVSRWHSCDEFSHLDQKGGVSMVDVGVKEVSRRYARAVGTVSLGEKVFKRITDNCNTSKKGNILETAKLSGIMAAKRTSELIPLCHSVPLDHVFVQVTPQPDSSSLKVTCEVRCESRTGCEMEALTGVTVSCLTLYDMCKSLSHEIVIDRVQLAEKSGGKSGHFLHTSIVE